jgi:hypothetical protein
LLTLTFSVLVGLALAHWRSSPGPYVRRLNMKGHWICAPGHPSYAGYFRRHVRVSGPVKHAWVAVAPCEGFEICVNQNPCGRFYLWRPTRPYQTGLSEGGQVLNPTPAALALNFPREYQWSSHRNDWLPVFLDITKYFVPGSNVITLEIESRKAPAMVRLEGEILLWSGERIRFDSDSEWHAEPVPPLDIRHDWSDPRYADHEWRHAVDLTRSGLDLPDLHFRSFDQRVLTTPFSGDWIRDDRALSGDAVWFEAEWDLPSMPDDAWLRLAVNRSFDLFINDHRAMVALLGNPDLDSGDWLLGTPRGADLPAAPELLDPDEVGSLFVGNRFESPRHGDPTAVLFKDRTAREKQLNKTKDKPWATDRADLPGTYDVLKEEGQDVMPHEATPYQPETHEPKALGRDRAIGGLVAYDVHSMIKVGRNTIKIRLTSPLSPDAFNWPAQLAVDGEASFPDGTRLRIATEPATRWKSRTQTDAGTLAPDRPVTVIGPARVIGNPRPSPVQPGPPDSPVAPELLGISWPTTLYRGIAHDPSQILLQKVQWLLASLASSAAVVAAMLAFAYRKTRGRGYPPWAALDDAARMLGRLLLPPISVLLAALLTETSWAERHEAIAFRLPHIWPRILLLTAGSPLMLSRPARALAHKLMGLPKTRAWWPMIGAVLVLCGVLRIYKLDFQPMDDDEYASCQAVIGIARTGAPGFVADGVYYTRSPAYHYLVGAFVWAFGENLWAMRLPCAAFGVATALLIYRFAARLMHRPWAGFGAMLLFTLHPFAIFSGHLVRFYQQQQFCSLVAVHWFCEGFIGTPSQKYRYLTTFAFFIAVISQEITAIMAFQLLLGLFWMGREAGWGANIRLVIVGAIAIAFIVLDLLVFQTRCLTRMEGVSPNVEASIKPHYWDPYNLISLFLGYSRLHVPPSLILLLALPLLIRRGGRVVWALLFFMLTGVLLTNLMVTHVSLRYQYWMITLWLILAVRGLGLLAERFAANTRRGDEEDTRAVAAILALPIFFSFLLAWSPWRIVDSYDCKILNDSTGAFRYVRSQLRPGDAIAANEPHPHAAFLEAGRVDYDLTVPMLHDFVMLQHGRLIDRNGGGEVIASLDDLIDACRKHERLWVVVNREKFRTRGKNIRWEYPAARIELFLRKNLQVAHRSYLWTVFLWDRSSGRFRGFREN